MLLIPIAGIGRRNPGQVLSHYVSTMRDRFRKALARKKGQSGSGPIRLTDREKELLRQWSFLEEFIKPHKRGTAVGVGRLFWEFVYNF